MKKLRDENRLRRIPPQQSLTLVYLLILPVLWCVLFGFLVAPRRARTGWKLFQINAITEAVISSIFNRSY